MSEAEGVHWSTLETHDQHLMDNYLKQVSQNLGAILKRQHDDKYGFGDHIDSNLQNEKNGSENVNDPDARNTESVENYFGNLDQEIRKTGALGFGKCNDDLVVKYSWDLVDGQNKWWTKANIEIAAHLKLKQEAFDKNQKSLMAKDIDEEDAAKLAMRNRVIKCVSACKKSHGGPLTAVEELNDLVEKWKGSEKSLHTVLDLEISFRKITFFNVKATCPLSKLWVKHTSKSEKLDNPY